LDSFYNKHYLTVLWQSPLSSLCLW